MDNNDKGVRCALCGEPTQAGEKYCPHCLEFRDGLLALTRKPVQRAVPDAEKPPEERKAGARQRTVKCAVCGVEMTTPVAGRPRKYCPKCKVIKDREHSMRSYAKRKAAAKAVSLPVAAVRPAPEGNVAAAKPAAVARPGVSEEGRRAGIGSILDEVMERLLEAKMRMTFAGDPAEARAWLADRLDSLRGRVEIVVTVVDNEGSGE